MNDEYFRLFYFINHFQLKSYAQKIEEIFRTQPGFNIYWSVANNNSSIVL